MEPTASIINFNNLLNTIVYLIPLGLLVWKMAKLSSKVDHNAKDIAGLAHKHEKEMVEITEKHKSDKRDIQEDVDVKYQELKEAIDDNRDRASDTSNEILSIVSDIRVELGKISVRIDHLAN